jgi:hypothetical protein
MHTTPTGPIGIAIENPIKDPFKNKPVNILPPGISNQIT